MPSKENKTFQKCKKKRRNLLKFRLKNLLTSNNKLSNQSSSNPEQEANRIVKQKLVEK